MFSTKKIFLFIPILLINQAYADIVPPSHRCTQPYKPLNFSSQLDVQNFNWEVGNYKKCIERFVEEQEESVKNHQEAAQDAIDDWNNFVRFELN